MKYRTVLILLGTTLVAIAVGVLITTANRQKVLADVTSPSGAWRVQVLGKRVLMGGIEVTAEVLTGDNRAVSLGVIDLRPNWPEAEHFYQAHESLHTRIDEVKAIVGERLLIRDDFIPNEDHSVTGLMGTKQVTLPIGELNNLGFLFTTGLWDGRSDHVRIMIVDFPNKFATTRSFTVDATMERPFQPDDGIHMHYGWKDAETGDRQGGAKPNGFSLTLNISEVTEHVVLGSVHITADNPRIDLKGEFRLLNSLPQLTH
jgi:hypothetical protein